jgi:hypothetical protein
MKWMAQNSDQLYSSTFAHFSIIKWLIIDKIENAGDRKHSSLSHRSIDLTGSTLKHFSHGDIEMNFLISN